MNKSSLIFLVAVALLCGTGISNAQDRDQHGAAPPRNEGMHRGDGSHKGDDGRDRRHRPAVIVVGVPVLVGPAYGSYAYGSYYWLPPDDAYRTLEGFYYYCMEPAGYYPALQECPTGWRLVP